jgi:DNA polymerase-3 subunit alpha (Gram-positive type)
MEETNSKDLLSSLSFCVFDLETTGGNQKSDKIIEIGMVKIDNLKVGEKVNYLVDPERKIPDFIQKLTSIKQADVEGCPKIEELMDTILEFIGDRILVAHNASFDVPFLNSVLTRMGRKPIENKSICTNLMTKYLIPTMMNSNLNYMSKIFKIKHKKAHRALDDADATAKLFLNYLGIFEDKGVKKINHLYYPKNRYELDLANFKKDSPHKEIFKKIKDIDSPFLLSFKGKNGVILDAFPSSGTEKEHPYIQELVESTEWETLTIKLVGPFTEVLIKFNHLFSKLAGEQRTKVIDKLWELHIGEEKKKELKKVAKDKLNNDFVIMNHLVPEQFTIYPMCALGHRNELIFRYPGHKKKLLQYINSKGNKISSGKMRKVAYAAPLKEFLDCYMCLQLEENKEILIFNKALAKKNEEDFYHTMEKFLTENPNTYNYPQNYI